MYQFEATPTSIACSIYSLLYVFCLLFWHFMQPKYRLLYVINLHVSKLYTYPLFVVSVAFRKSRYGFSHKWQCV